MKYIFAGVIAFALLGATLIQASSGTQMAAPESCLNTITRTWGGCAATNAGLPETGNSGGGSKVIMMMTRATI